MNRSLLSVFWVLLMMVSVSSVLAQESGWPRTVQLEQGLVTIYPLQVDEMNDDIIHFRAALAYRETAGSEPVFGAGWFESRVEIDTTSRIVHPTDLKVIAARFPTGTDNVQQELAAVFAQQSPNWNLDFSLDELEAALKTAEAESQAAQNLNTAPPRIIYRDHPALLISMDGAPILREIEDSPLEAVINTQYPLIFDGKHYYLNAAKGVWYRAGQATGPYQYEAVPPAEIAAMVVNADEPAAADEQTGEAITAANAPEIVVSTEPAELIVTEGPADFAPLVDDLLVLQNSDDDVFMHVGSQKYYIVLAGRWYHASSLNGPWAYRSADDLPAAFANIPRNSDQADSRVYVAGTEEAQDAVLDAQVPQTAAVARGEVDIDVEYDGDPIFEPVDGTDLVYAENTGSTVIQSDGLYYLVEDGVWYVSSSPNGPWQVSDHRPQQAGSILPTSPVYNVRYVQVYDSTPSVVYVGYTPGYLGSYVYHNTIFYGSGWYYRPWISPYYYYPRHSSWGFNVSYNYWSGWGFGLSWGWGPFSFGYYSGGYWHQNHYWHHRYYGHWGPRGYWGRPVHYGRGRYGNRGYPRGGHGRGGYDRNANRGYRPNTHERNGNLYRDGAQRARIADTRDNQPRSPRERGRNIRQPNYTNGSGSRQPNYTNGSGSRQQNYVRPNKAGDKRPGRVNSSDLRFKAEARDANFEARRNRLLADNSGNVYSRPGRNPDRNDAISRNSLAAKSPANRTRPLPGNSGRDYRKNGAPARVKGSERRTTRPTARASSRQSQPRPADKPARQSSSPAANSPVRQSRPRTSSYSSKQQSSPAEGRQSRPRTNSYSARQQSSPAAGRQSRPRTNSYSARQQPSPAAGRHTQPRTNNYRAPQRPIRVVSAPAQKQSSSRPGSQPQSSRNSGRNHSAPAQRAPRGSTHSSGGRSYGSSGGGRRGGGSRSRRS